MLGLWHRLRALDGRRRRLLCEAALALLIARVRLTVLPFAAMRRPVTSRADTARTRTRPIPDTPQDIGWAIGAAARRLPGMTCLVQAIAADRLLRRAGWPSELRIGMRRPTPEAPLEGHAWVVCDGQIVVGGAVDLERYAPLTTLAPTSPTNGRDWVTALLRADDHLPAPPDDVLEHCRAEDVTPLVSHLARAHRDYLAWPEAFRAGLEAESRAAAAHELTERAALREALMALEQAGASPLLLKGTALAYTIYAAPSHRGRADTDLLVPAARLPAARRALERVGFAAPPYSAGTELFGQVPLLRRDQLGVEHWIDLHWAVSAAKVFADALTYRELAAQAVSIPALGPHARAPGTVHSLLLACMHPVMHHRNAERLAWVYDIHLLAGGLGPREWQAFADLAAEKRLCAVAAHGLARAADLFGTRVPATVMNVLRSPAGAEPSAEYLEPSRGWLHELMSNLRARDWPARVRLLREIALPSPTYMRESYGLAASAGAGLFLPLLYAHRGLRGLARLALGSK